MDNDSGFGSTHGGFHCFRIPDVSALIYFADL
jgi:hypothetical protein